MHRRAEAISAYLALDPPHGMRREILEDLASRDWPGPDGCALVEPVGEAEKIHLVDGVQHLDDRALDKLVLQRRDTERPLPGAKWRTRTLDRLLTFQGAGTPSQKIQPQVAFGEIFTDELVSRVNRLAGGEARTESVRQ